MFSDWSELTFVGVMFAVLVAAFFAINRFTRLGVVARGTFRESIRQPIFLFMVVIAAGLFLLYIFLPFFTLGEDTKVYIDSCLAMTLVSSLLLAVWSASQSVAEEREGKTVMTLLSKPITRAEFILGKYVGILQAVLLQMLILAFVLVPCVAWKYGVDKKESGGGRVDWVERTEVFGTEMTWLQKDRQETALSILPPLAMVFLQVAVMTSVAVALSTRLPALVGIIACFAIFVVGNLVPTLVQTSLQDAVFLKFIAQLFAAIFPALWSFDTFTAISTGRTIPVPHLTTIAFYSVCYIAAMMLLAFLLFEDEDLA